MNFLYYIKYLSSEILKKIPIIDRFYKANLKFKYDYIIEVDGDDIMTDF